MNLDLKALIGKLNAICRRGLETAAGLCVSQTNYNVELEHLLLKLLEFPDTDILRVLRYYEVDPAEVNRELTQAMERFKRGNSRTPTLSPQIIQVLQEAWLVSSLHLGTPLVRSGAVLLALLDHETFRGMLLDSSTALLRIPRDPLRQDIREIIRGSSEDTVAGALSGEREPLEPLAAGAAGRLATGEKG